MSAPVCVTAPPASKVSVPAPRLVAASTNPLLSRKEAFWFAVVSDRLVTALLLLASVIVPVPVVVTLSVVALTNWLAAPPWVTLAPAVKVVAPLVVTPLVPPAVPIATPSTSVRVTVPVAAASVSISLFASVSVNTPPAPDSSRLAAMIRTDCVTLLPLPVNRDSVPVPRSVVVTPSTLAMVNPLLSRNWIADPPGDEIATFVTVLLLVLRSTLPVAVMRKLVALTAPAPVWAIVEPVIRLTVVAFGVVAALSVMAPAVTDPTRSVPVPAVILPRSVASSPSVLLLSAPPMLMALPLVVDVSVATRAAPAVTDAEIVIWSADRLMLPALLVFSAPLIVSAVVLGVTALAVSDRPEAPVVVIAFAVRLLASTKARETRLPDPVMLVTSLPVLVSV